MSGREWESGDVAMLDFKNGEQAIGVRNGPNQTAGWSHAASFGGGSAYDYIGGFEARPLVVIDLPDGALAGWPVLIHALKVAREKTGFRMIFDGLIDQIEAQTANPTQPKPDEPTGLGAVVRDAGTRWTLAVRIPGSFPWVGEHGGVRGWNEFSDAVEVLSEGVTS